MSALQLENGAIAHISAPEFRPNLLYTGRARKDTFLMKETPRRRISVTSSLYEMFTDQLKNRVVFKGRGAYSPPLLSAIGIRTERFILHLYLGQSTLAPLSHIYSYTHIPTLLSLCVLPFLCRYEVVIIFRKQNFSCHAIFFSAAVRLHMDNAVHYHLFWETKTLFLLDWLNTAYLSICGGGVNTKRLYILGKI